MDAVATEAAVALEDVTVRFGGLTALDRATVKILPGEIAAVVGLNGAGKSTLLNAICGLARPESGSVEVLGEDVTGWGPAQIANLGVGRSFQEPRLIETESVLANLLVGAHGIVEYGVASWLFRWSRCREVEVSLEGRAMELLRVVGLEEMADQLPSQLSYGSRKLLDICRALCRGPRILILDEPTSGLDEDERERLQDFVERVDTGDIAVILVEHNLQFVNRISTNVVALQDGSVMLAGPTMKVTASPEYQRFVSGKKIHEGDTTEVRP